MRMWDVEHGLAVQDIPTETSSPITCLAQELPTGPVVVAGDSEGCVRVFDCRLSSRSSYVSSLSSLFSLSLGGHGPFIPHVCRLVQSYAEHKRAVIQVEMLYDPVKIVSGSVGGDVRFFDLRAPCSLHTFQAHSRSEMTSLAVHRHAPVLATYVLLPLLVFLLLLLLLLCSSFSFFFLL